MKTINAIFCLAIACAVLFLLIAGAIAALSGFLLYKPVEIPGSTAGAVSNYTLPITVSWESNPIKTGTWAINSRTYNNRIEIPITETTNAALTDYMCFVEINTKWLVDNGYFHASADGNEVEFALGTDTSGLEYYCDTFNEVRSIYYVKTSLTARQSITMYFYFDADLSSTSSNTGTVADVWPVTTINKQVSQVTDDFTTGNYASNNVVQLGDGHTSGYRFTSIDLMNDNLNAGVYAWGTCYLTLTSAAGLGFDTGTGVRTKISGRDVDNPATFSSALKGTETTAKVDWDVSTTWVEATEYNSPDISTILEEIVNRSGWAENNAMVFYISDDGSTTSNDRFAYGYNYDSTKAAKLHITAYEHPDYAKLPIVNVPPLYDAQVFCDNQCENWPYDVVFTDPDGTDIYEFAPIRETLQSKYNRAITFNVTITDEIPVDPGSLTIRCYYKNASQTTELWDPDSTFTDYSDFEFGTAGFTVVNGTWASNNQQRPIYKAGKESWSRVPIVIPNGPETGTDTMLTWDGDYWEELGIYPGGPWRLPWFTTKHTTQDWEILKSHGPNWEDRAVWADTSSGNLQNCFIGNAVYYNLKWWLPYKTIGHPSKVGICSTTDFETYDFGTANPIWTEGDQGSPSGTDRSIGTASLMRTADDTEWLIYLSYINDTAPNDDVHYLFATCASGTDPDDVSYTWGGQCYSPSTYVEAIQPVWDATNGQYRMFYSDLDAGYQNIQVSNGTTNPHSFAGNTELTFTKYEVSNHSQGMQYIWHDGTDWNLVCYTKPDYTGDEPNNYFIHLKANSWPTTWTPQNVEPMMKSSGTGTELLLVNGGSYSNSKFYAPIMLDQGDENAGIFFREQDSSNYYDARFDRSENEIQLWRTVSGTPAKLAETALTWTMEDSGSAYNLMVYNYGTTIDVYTSEQGSIWDHSISTSDASLPSTGNAGLIGVSSEFWANEFYVAPYIYPEPVPVAGEAIEVGSAQVYTTIIQ